MCEIDYKITQDWGSYWVTPTFMSDREEGPTFKAKTLKEAHEILAMVRKNRLSDVWRFYKVYIRLGVAT